jgi:hypothetical protein
MKLISEIVNKEVKSIAVEAENFLLSHKWCKKIVSGKLAWACGKILGVFFFEIEPVSTDVDKELWVITGDIPPAYLVIDDASNWSEALECYINEMDIWVKAVRGKKDVKDIIPVNAPQTEEYANMLEGRLKFIKNEIIEKKELIESDF